MTQSAPHSSYYVYTDVTQTDRQTEIRCYCYDASHASVGVITPAVCDVGYTDK